MKMRQRAAALFITGMLAVLPAGSQSAKAPAAGREKIAVPLRFDRYYTYAEVVEALKALHEAYPQMTTLDLVGRSEEGREIWAVTVNNPKTGLPLTKPGVYVDGNVHGNEIQAAEVALGVLNLLLTRYGQNEALTRLVDRNAFYILPVVNVDGRHHFFADANTPSSDRTIRIPKDDDRDGLVDEDGPDDLDGDGNVCEMRIKDPHGPWKTDPEDARLMVRVKPGEKGEWTLLGDEGLDNDGDGRINEDPPGYVDGNRNWGYNWAPPYVQSGSGYYPFEAVGIRAIARYIMERPNILVVYAFHNSGGMFLRGPSTRAEEPLNPSDVAVYDLLGQNAEKIVPGYRYLVAWKDLYATYGDFTNFTYNIAGAYSFVGELFVVESETYRNPAEKPVEAVDRAGEMMRRNAARDRERLLFSDHVAQGELFKPWKPLRHPQYGEIEIGGWVKMSTRLPHPFMLPDLVHRNASAVLFAASQTPAVTMEVVSADKVTADLRKVRIRLANSGGLPTATYQSLQKKPFPPDFLRVSGQGLRVVAGGLLRDPYRDLVDYKRGRPELQPAHVPGYGKTEFQFLISGKGTAEFTFTSRKAGTVSVRLPLN